ncbi:hypothetical protein [Nonomuraea insulae]|uniref:Uncharacterized protein n=1 Tax=Nonomuraea insulae TaxID=1616787 RepID=A0ABW1CSR0_9ACTN
MTRQTRTLPALAAGRVEMPYAILTWSESFACDTTWNEHSHPFHELLWNERGASTAVVGSRAWTITPTLLERLAGTDLAPGSRAVTEAMVLDVLTPSSHELLLHVPTSDLLRPIADAVRDDPGDRPPSA